MARYTARHSASLQRRADDVQAQLRAQDDAWGTGGWTRRRFIAGAGMVGAAGLATQMVTSRAAFGATPAGTENTLVVVFMRGAADGLRILVPNSSALGVDHLHSVRPGLVPADSALVALPGTGGWALNAAAKPVYDALWGTGELAFVPAVSTNGVSRSHFEAQQYLEKGGVSGATSGWLDRVLDRIGPGTTFRAIASGAAEPLSLTGPQDVVTVQSMDRLKLSVDPSLLAAEQQALLTLYRGLGGDLGDQVSTTVQALATGDAIRAARPAQHGASYPQTAFSSSLQDIAGMLRAEVGLQVATVDVGGWDTHTDEVHDLDANLGSFAQSLAAFMTDLGPQRRSRVTVVVQTEFGRRVAQNGTGGTDHGHGSVMWLLGGGLTSSGVKGAWTKLADAVLDNGDVPGLNSPFAVLGDIVQQRLGVGSLSTVFGSATAPAIRVAKAH